MREIVITPQTAGGRLDKLLIKYFDKAGSGFVYKMLRRKNITLNDRKADGNVLLASGDVIRLYLSEDTIEKLHTSCEKQLLCKEHKAKNMGNKLKSWDTSAFKGLKLVFEDDNIIAVSKPAGLLSQKARQKDISVNDFIISHISGTDIFKPGIANRLDRNTSGIILAAKNPAAARELNKAIRDRNISKKYLTLVSGRITADGRLEGWLSKNEKNNKVQIFTNEHPGCDHIITEYSSLGTDGRVTLLEADLITGRSHQIRAHFASVGYPVCGDPKYGDKDLNSMLRRKYGLNFQLLHAYKVEFNGTQGILSYLNGTEIFAEPPAYFANILTDMGFNIPAAPGQI